ncbi:MAG: YkuS family protein [Sporomusaceae bacterium]|nr:YkuS family protein [Sporomusaceae bacterium]
MFRVSVETGLREVKEHLHSQGYEVVDMAETIRPVQAIVYAGPVVKEQFCCRCDGDSPLFINATALTKEQVVENLQAPFQ